MRPRSKQNKNNRIELNGSHTLHFKEEKTKVGNIACQYDWQNLTKVLRSCDPPSVSFHLDFS